MIELFKSLGDENRLRIINLLMHAELCVCELEVMLKMTQSNVSRHLSKLKSNRIISSSKDAQWVHHKISSEFKDENELLYRYLKTKFQISNLYLKDLERYNRYKEHNMNCQWINQDRQKVLNILERKTY